MGAHELRAARAHAAVAAGYEHVRVATIEADNALAHAPSLATIPRHAISLPHGLPATPVITPTLSPTRTSFVSSSGSA